MSLLIATAVWGTVVRVFYNVLDMKYEFFIIDMSSLIVMLTIWIIVGVSIYYYTDIIS
ncbi:Uncharacterised protein [Enterobacter hormaechei]|uniref:Uncharacterized protein n=1 Tax=Klebsiella quasivariicola TaxID=2026240 RepID=A0A8B4TYG1_9ENTR|nr:Uncharacterised protein [Klebsiella quasipneumoniae]SBL19262.1 Uncharacterised protein [Klebsiella michiganensis]SXD97461.1 Uncharacterised protein [Klebsiella quasivariicola]SYT88078.1 Uncharacterised protein [Klebsiella pneumoniae]VAG28700.1 Uncharacterised protein [Enterobacter hormaechei]